MKPFALLAVLLAGLLAILACGSPAVTDADVAFDVADDARVPIAEVTFELNAPPEAPQTDLSAWLSGGFCTLDQRHYLSCPDFKTDFGCQAVYDAGAYSAWLDSAVPPLLCSRWCRELEGSASACTEGDGLVQHQLGGFVDYLLVLDNGVPEALRTSAELAARYAPVDSEGKALSFVAFLVPQAVHKFWPHVAGAPSDVDSWMQVDDEACTSATIEGTTVTPTDDGYLVSTFRGPDWNGCTYDGLVLERLVVSVSRTGVVRVESATSLCYGDVPCYD
jgi:hypothetical protein